MNKTNSFKFLNFGEHDEQFGQLPISYERAPQRVRNNDAIPNLINEFGPTLDSNDDADYEPNKKKARGSTVSATQSPAFKHTTHSTPRQTTHRTESQQDQSFLEVRPHTNAHKAEHVARAM